LSNELQTVQQNSNERVQQVEYSANQRIQQLEAEIQKLRVFDTLNNEATLHQNQTLVSKNGSWVARLQDDGNFVLYAGHAFSSHNAFWASNTGGVGSGPFKLVMQNDGNLCVYESNGNCTWASNTWQKGQAPYRLVMQNDRNLVIYSHNGEATWASNTWQG